MAEVSGDSTTHGECCSMEQPHVGVSVSLSRDRAEATTQKPQYFSQPLHFPTQPFYHWLHFLSKVTLQPLDR